MIRINYSVRFLRRIFRLVQSNFDTTTPTIENIHDVQQRHLCTNKPQRPLVLGIETSCDDTGAAVVSGDGRILGEAINSQTSLTVE